MMGDAQQGQTNVDAKVILLGSSNVGKTCLFQRFLTNRYTADPSAVCHAIFFTNHSSIITVSFVTRRQTIGASYGEKHMTVDGKTLVIGLWDTAGSERYESMTRMYYRGANVAIACYGL